MDTSLLINAGLVLVFVLVGGVFAATEMAIVSLRQSQVDDFDRAGPRGQRIAALVRDPNRFLSAVQVGVTVAGFFSSAFGGATLAPYVSRLLQSWGLGSGLADSLALVLMTLVIAYLSLVLGELVPKRLAMQRAKAFTSVLAPPLGVLSVVLKPVIWLLSASTNLVVRALGGDPEAAGEEMSLEEVRRIIEDNRELRPYPRQILRDVIRAGEHRLQDVLTPRTDVQFLSADTPLLEVERTVRESSFSRFPVIGRSADDVLGVVHVRDLLAVPHEERGGLRVADVTRPVTAYPPTKPVLATLAEMREAQQHLAIVVDEHGGTDGIVTIEDLVEELVGEIYDEYDITRNPEDVTVRSAEGLEVSGGLNVDELADMLKVEIETGPFETVGGLVMARLGRVAEVGDTVEVSGLVLTVEEVDGYRVVLVGVRRAVPADDPEGPAETNG
ncbi:putative hemolysin [Ornithinimicrobium humiphilum]|uniref:Putative hemolysin n=1 Tax=Ornithinimicrobium humiphilum TaxID=125288 RepID=A0A543KLZ4_9MICO|nr:hemolysin family protein [Ornithinimicrobium humiphilum]TQM96113.1 putative hemolysin [Ornithinimicrobium humiphilum]